MNFTASQSPRPTRRFSRWQTSKRTFNLGGSPISKEGSKPNDETKPNRKNTDVELKIKGKLAKPDHPGGLSAIASEKDHSILDVLQNASNCQSSIQSTQKSSKHAVKIRKIFESIAVDAIEEKESGTSSEDIDRDKNFVPVPVQEKENDGSLLRKESTSHMSASEAFENVSSSLQSKENPQTENDRQDTGNSASVPKDKNIRETSTRDDISQDSCIGGDGETAAVTSKNTSVRGENSQTETSVAGLSNEKQNTENKELEEGRNNSAMKQNRKPSSSFTHSTSNQYELNESRSLRNRNSIRQPPAAHYPVEFLSTSQKNSLKKKLFDTSKTTGNISDESITNKSKVDSPRKNVSKKADLEVPVHLRGFEGKSVSQDEKGGEAENNASCSTNKFAHIGTERIDTSPSDQNAEITLVPSQPANASCTSLNKSQVPKRVEKLPDSSMTKKYQQTEVNKINEQITTQSRASSSKNNTSLETANKGMTPSVNHSVSSGRSASLRDRNSIRKPPPSSYPVEFFSSSERRSSSSKSNANKSKHSVEKSNANNSKHNSVEKSNANNSKHNSVEKSNTNRSKRKSIEKSTSGDYSKELKTFEDTGSNGGKEQALLESNASKATSYEMSRKHVYSTTKIANPCVVKVSGKRTEGNQRKAASPMKGGRINKSQMSTDDKDENNPTSVEQSAEISSNHEGLIGRRNLRQRDSIRKPPPSHYPKEFSSSGKEKQLPSSKFRKQLFNSSSNSNSDHILRESQSKRKSQQPSIEENEVVAKVKRLEEPKPQEKSRSMTVEATIEKEKQDKRSVLMSSGKSFDRNKSKLSRSLRDSNVSVDTSPANGCNVSVGSLPKKPASSNLSINVPDKNAMEKWKSPNDVSRKSKKDEDSNKGIALPREEDKSPNIELEKSVSIINNSSIGQESSTEHRSLRNRSLIRKPPPASYPVQYLSSNKMKASSLVSSNSKVKQKDESYRESKATRKTDGKRRYHLPKKRPANRLLEIVPEVPDTPMDSTLHISPSLMVVDASTLVKDNTGHHSHSNKKNRDGQEVDTVPASSQVDSSDNNQEGVSCKMLGSQPLEDTFHGIHKRRRKRNLFSDSDPPSQSEIKVEKKGQSSQVDPISQDNTGQGCDNELPVNKKRNNSKLSLKDVSRKPENSKSKQNGSNARVHEDFGKRKANANDQLVLKTRQRNGFKTREAVCEWMSSYQSLIRELRQT